MSGTIVINDPVGTDVCTSSLYFDVIWNILNSSASAAPFVHDKEYLDRLSWRERSWDCFLDLRKCQRPTLEAIREMMIQHADSNHSYWKHYDQHDGPAEGLTVEQAIRRSQACSQKVMIQVAEAIKGKLEAEATTKPR